VERERQADAGQAAPYATLRRALLIVLGVSSVAVLVATLTPDGADRTAEFVRSFDGGPLSAAFRLARGAGIHADEAAVVFHFLLFAVFGAALGGVLAARRIPNHGTRLAIGLAAAVLLATVTEFAQNWVRDRSPTLADWSADVGGAVLGLTVGTLVLWPLLARAERMLRRS
jgi:hypothetical protein